MLTQLRARRSMRAATCSGLDTWGQWPPPIGVATMPRRDGVSKEAEVQRQALPTTGCLGRAVDEDDVDGTTLPHPA